MNKTLTIDCGGVTISGTALSTMEVQLNSVLELFRPYSAEFRDGFSLQIGWGPIILRADTPTSYTLVVPDYAYEPHARVIDDLTLSLWVLISQTAVFTSAGLAGEPSPIHFLDDVVIHKGALDTDMIVLTRNEPRKGDSGWYVDEFPQTSEDPTVEDLVKYPAYYLLQLNKYAVAVMLLPAGIGALVNKETVQFVYREADYEVLAHNPLPGSN